MGGLQASNTRRVEKQMCCIDHGHDLDSGPADGDGDNHDAR
jgi:hypothetical protein